MKKWVYCIGLIILYACSGSDEDQKATPVPEVELNKRWQIIHAARDSIREGDLVVRCGNDYTSLTLKDFSQQDKSYSHSGIAIKIDSGIYIFHNMAGDLNPKEIMRRDPIDSFLTPVNNVAFGVYRYDMTVAEREELNTIVQQHFLNKLQFDMNFDLESDDKMYCVEMIAKSIEQATDQRIQFAKSMVNDELRNKYLKMALQKKVLPSPKAADQREYLAIDNLYINPHCRQIIKHVFEINTGLISIPPPEPDSINGKSKN